MSNVARCWGSHSVHSALPLDVSMEFAFRNHGIQLMWNSVDSMPPALIWEGTCYIRLPEVHNSVASQIHNGGVWNVRSTLPDYHTKYQGECIRHGAIQVGLAQWVDISGLTSYIYQSIYICINMWFLHILKISRLYFVRICPHCVDFGTRVVH